jgi:hypothetical protein
MCEVRQRKIHGSVGYCCQCKPIELTLTKKQPSYWMVPIDGTVGEILVRLNRLNQVEPIASVDGDNY